MSKETEFSWDDLKNTKAGDVKAPPVIPAGHYEAIITGPFTQRSAKSGNKGMEFPVKLVAATDDVDAEALEAAGGVPDKTYGLTFWMSPDARFMFTQFTKSMGISEDLDLIAQAEELAGLGDTFTVEVRIDTDENNPDRKYTRLERPVGSKG